MSPATRRQLLHYALAVAVMAAALAVRWLSEPWLQGRLPFVTVLAAVALSVWIGGAGPGVLAAALGFGGGALIWLLGDRTHAGLFDVGYGVAAVVYIVTCGFIIGFIETLRSTRQRLEDEVAQRRQAEQHLRESEEHYRHTVDLNPQVTWTATPDGQLDRVAERWQTWTGTSGLGDGWGRGLHPHDLGFTSDTWVRSVTSGQPYDIEHRVRMVSGAYRWMRSRAFPRRDERGLIVKWYGATEDIHERKLAEAALHEANSRLEQQVAARTAALQASEARMRTIFATSFQYQGLLAIDGTLLDANPTLLRGIESQLDDVLGQPFWDTPWFSKTPGMPEAVREAVRVASAGRSVRQEMMLMLPSGWRHFDFAMRPVHGDDGAVVGIVPEAVDVTERVYAEEKLRQSQKMEAVGQLTGGVAHDFNNLLQVISANLHLVAKHVGGNDQVDRRLASAQEAVKRGAKLANQLLAFGRRQALEPKTINVGRFVNGMEDMLRRSIGEAVEVETIVSGGLWNTLVDPTQIENALLNLAINARDAMDGSGKLTIEVGNAFLDEAYARAHADVKAGQYVMLAVSDTGSGMTPEVMAQAFEPFFSTKPAGTGTGLGLSMVYGFVKQSGGHVKIYSEPGQGTSVKLYLPRVRQTEDPVEPLASGPVVGGTETVLVVEDDAAVRNATVEMLTELGYRVLKANDADSALTVIESGIDIDLLFTDVVMPGHLKSPELARKARERLPHLAVLFTSGYTQNAIVHGGRLDAGVELLPKPYTAQALAQRVRAVLGQPAKQSVPTASMPSGEASAPPTPSRITVLLVEDDQLVRASTAEMLRDLGHSVIEASSAEEAKALLHTAPIDVLVTDIGLPGVSGDVFAAEARSVRPNIRLVFATGNARIHDAGGDGTSPVLLRKPYDSVAIEAALSAAGVHRH